MISTSRITNWAAMRVPPALLRQAKRTVRYPRYYTGLAAARRGFRLYGDRYPNRYLFVAGLPKSGTSWVERMLANYPGYSLVSHPELTETEYERSGTHGFELPSDFFSRLGKALCVVKIHCHGSENNRRVLERSKVPYVVLYRDLRDAAVSHVFYVKRTPWHPEYPTYRDLDVKAGLSHFARTLLPEWRDWIKSWKNWSDPCAGIEMRYEEILADAHAGMKRLAEFYGLPFEPVEAIVDANSFERLKTQGTFFRKGIAGDWVTHFDIELKHAFKREIGRELVEWGYETSDDW